MVLIALEGVVIFGRASKEDYSRSENIKKSVKTAGKDDIIGEMIEIKAELVMNLVRNFVL